MISLLLLLLRLCPYEFHHLDTASLGHMWVVRASMQVLNGAKVEKRCTRDRYIAHLREQGPLIGLWCLLCPVRHWQFIISALKRPSIPASPHLTKGVNVMDRAPAEIPSRFFVCYLLSLSGLHTHAPSAASVTEHQRTDVTTRMREFSEARW